MALNINGYKHLPQNGKDGLQKYLHKRSKDYMSRGLALSSGVQQQTCFYIYKERKETLLVYFSSNAGADGVY